MTKYSLKRYDIKYLELNNNLEVLESEINEGKKQIDGLDLGISYRYEIDIWPSGTHKYVLIGVFGVHIEDNIHNQSTGEDSYFQLTAGFKCLFEVNIEKEELNLDDRRNIYMDTFKDFFPHARAAVAMVSGGLGVTPLLLDIEEPGIEVDLSNIRYHDDEV